MYRLSPFTYIVGGISATGLHSRPVQCDQNEVLVFDTPNTATCGNYLQAYLTQAPGQLLNPAATSQCQYCPLSNADQFLALSSISWDSCWVNFGIVWAYIGFNIVITLTLYYMFRVKAWKRPKYLCGWFFWFKQIYNLQDGPRATCGWTASLLHKREDKFIGILTSKKLRN